jgi:hypothetical protein
LEGGSVGLERKTTRCCRIAAPRRQLGVTDLPTAFPLPTSHLSGTLLPAACVECNYLYNRECTRFHVVSMGASFAHAARAIGIIL